MVGRSVGDVLGEAIVAAAAVDLDTLTDDELDAELVALLRDRHRLDAQIARRAARWDARAVWRSDGSRSAPARLSRDAKLPKSAAKQIIRRGRAAVSFAFVAAAWAAGEISGDHVDRLATAAGDGRHELFARDERMLVGYCRDLLPRHADAAVAYWRQRADAELQRDGTPPPKPTSLRMTTTFGGAVTGDFTLDPIGGATVAESLRRIERDLYRQDQRDGITRTKLERMAAALVEMAVRAHAVPAGGRRPEPLVTILAGESTIEHLCELAAGTVIEPGVIVPHMCRSAVQTFIFDGADCVVAASPTRTFRGMLRRAIQVRDRHCQHPSGCDAPITECDVNHRVPWAEGGATTERDGDLECEPHNRHSDLHHRAPPEVLEDARWRRETEALARERVDTLVVLRQRPPPAPSRRHRPPDEWPVAHRDPDPARSPPPPGP